MAARASPTKKRTQPEEEDGGEGQPEGGGERWEAAPAVGSVEPTREGKKLDSGAFVTGFLKGSSRSPISISRTTLQAAERRWGPNFEPPPSPDVPADEPQILSCPPQSSRSLFP